MQQMEFWSLGGEDPLEKEWPPTPVFLPGESHGQRSLVGYSPWDRKELGIPEAAEYTGVWGRSAFQTWFALNKSRLCLTF